MKYVAYCDILGFSHRVESKFDETIELYTGFIKKVADRDFLFPEVTVTMYSDGILLVSDKLIPLCQAVQMWSWFALGHDFLIRGGVAYGRYWEHREGKHLFVVSDALVRSVRMEHAIGVPAVGISDEVEIHDLTWAGRFEHGPFVIPVLYFDGKRIVNPFTLYWGTSAGMRVQAMKAQYPQHAAKYDWFQSLLDAVKANDILIPEDVLQRCVDHWKVLKRVAPDETRSHSVTPPSS